MKEYNITCLVGVTGCGKTSVAQYLTLNAISQNKKVWSNVPLSGAMQLDFEDLLKFEFTKENEEGILIIDEAGIYINNRDWEKLSKDVITFFKLHRHFRIDVYIFSQGEDIDITFRRLAHNWYKIIKPWYGFGRYSALIPVSTMLAIENGKWSLKYEAQQNFFAMKHIPIYKTWKYFNSFSRPTLPSKQFKIWDMPNIETKIPFLTTIKLKIHSLTNTTKKLLFKAFMLKKKQQRYTQIYKDSQEFKDTTY